MVPPGVVMERNERLGDWRIQNASTQEIFNAAPASIRLPGRQLPETDSTKESNL